MKIKKRKHCKSELTGVEKIGGLCTMSSVIVGCLDARPLKGLKQKMKLLNFGIATNNGENKMNYVEQYGELF